MFETRSQKLIDYGIKVKLHSEAGHFIRFAAVGLLSTLLDFVILTALKNWFSWPTLPSNIISYSCGILNSYVLTRFWVYPEAKKHGTARQMMQFIIVSLIGLALNNILVLALEIPAGKLLHNLSYGFIPAKVVATGVVFLWNFFANRFWTFNDLPQDTGKKETGKALLKPGSSI